MTRFTIQAQNFRALERLDWSPTGFCLLSGANGTGKSTVLDALRFLRTLFLRGHEDAFLKVGARYFRNVDVPESEAVAFEVRVEDIVWKLRFPMAAAGLKDTFGEELYRAGQLVLHADMFDQGWWLGEERSTRDKVRCCARVLWDRGDTPWMNPLVDAITGILVYKSYELEKVKRSEAVELRQGLLHEDGANLWSVLADWKGSAIRSEGRFEWVIATARESFPGQISTIEFERGFPVLYPPGAPNPDRGLPPERVADGLLTGLLHLAAIAGASPGSLVAFDEVENQLHPHAIRTLLAAMRERADAQGLTIVLTTHSPVVMNQFRDELEHVFVLDRSDPARPQPVGLTALHTEEWLAQAKLGTLYERLAFGAPLPAPPPP